MGIIVKDLNYYLALPYTYTVTPDDGDFVITYRDLPGCMTQVDDAGEIAEAAEEVKLLWLETAIEMERDIPEPVDADYSGRFVARVPKSLHQRLVEQAANEGVSLNTLVVQLLGERSVLSNQVVVRRELEPDREHYAQRSESGMGSRNYRVDARKEDSLRPRHIRLIKNSVAA